jgi:hypothetical protein
MQPWVPIAQPRRSTRQSDVRTWQRDPPWLAVDAPCASPTRSVGPGTRRAPSMVVSLDPERDASEANPLERPGSGAPGNEEPGNAEYAMIIDGGLPLLSASAAQMRQNAVRVLPRFR